jgi:rRNA maturation endonuclease Nob1
MNRPVARRDFVLDTGAILYFARDLTELAQWLTQIAALYTDPAVVIPVPVMTEIRTGSPRSDTNLDRVIAALTNRDDPDAHWLGLTVANSNRAGVLRTLGMNARVTGAKTRISPVDAQVVAIAEERSANNAVTILTSDPEDIQLLVDLTGAPNIGVQAV